MIVLRLCGKPFAASAQLLDQLQCRQGPASGAPAPPFPAPPSPLTLGAAWAVLTRDSLRPEPSFGRPQDSPLEPCRPNHVLPTPSPSSRWLKPSVPEPRRWLQTPARPLSHPSVTSDGPRDRQAAAAALLCYPGRAPGPRPGARQAFVKWGLFFSSTLSVIWFLYSCATPRLPWGRQGLFVCLLPSLVSGAELGISRPLLRSSQMRGWMSSPTSVPGSFLPEQMAGPWGRGGKASPSVLCIAGRGAPSTPGKARVLSAVLKGTVK